MNVTATDWSPLFFPSSFVIAFLLGSLPFGLWIARVFQVSDVREHGSGNIGATNVSRVAGFWPAGFLTFALDISKAILAIVLFGHFSQSIWERFEQFSLLHIESQSSWYLGLAAVMGHCFSPWLSFKGGKGVATGFGVLALLAPFSALVGIVAFAVAFFSRRVGSLASLSGLSLAVIAQLVFEPIDAGTIPFLLMVGLILFRHESNIEALLENKERAF